MVGAGTRGAYGAYGARGAYGRVPVLVLVLVFGAACDYTPAGRERAHVYDVLRAMPEVVQVTVGCEGGIFASDALCVDVITKDGAELRFERAGAKALGANASHVIVAQVGNLVPRIASCDSSGPPNLHRAAALGHHFQPTLIDMKDAIVRSSDVIEEIQFWPQCPQAWDVQDQHGVNYRYCAHRKDQPSEPPRPDHCAPD